MKIYIFKWYKLPCEVNANETDGKSYLFFVVFFLLTLQFSVCGRWNAWAECRQMQIVLEITLVCKLKHLNTIMLIKKNKSHYNVAFFMCYANIINDINSVSCHETKLNKELVIKYPPNKNGINIYKRSIHLGAATYSYIWRQFQCCWVW